MTPAEKQFEKVRIQLEDLVKHACALGGVEGYPQPDEEPLLREIIKLVELAKDEAVENTAKWVKHE